MTRSLTMALGLLLLATPAQAGPLKSATLEIELPFSLAPLSFEAAGATGMASSDVLGYLDAGTAFAGTLAESIPLGAFPPLTELSVVVGANDALTFSGATPGSVDGTGVFMATALPKSYAGIPAAIIPLPFGAPGTAYFGPLYAIAGTVYANAWTVGTTAFVVSNPTPSGATVVTRAGSNALTPSGAGLVRLVSAASVTTNIEPGPFPFVATLTLHFVPEPGPGLLLLAAAGGILAWRPKR